MTNGLRQRESRMQTFPWFKVFESCIGWKTASQLCRWHPSQSKRFVEDAIDSRDQQQNATIVHICADFIEIILSDVLESVRGLCHLAYGLKPSGWNNAGTELGRGANSALSVSGSRGILRANGTRFYSDRRWQTIARSNLRSIWTSQGKWAAWTRCIFVFDQFSRSCKGGASLDPWTVWLGPWSPERWTKARSRRGEW